MLLKASLLLAGLVAAEDDITNFVLQVWPKAFGNSDCSKNPYLTLKNSRIPLGECTVIDKQLGLDSILTCTEDGVLDWKKYKPNTKCKEEMTSPPCTGEGKTCHEVITNKECFYTQPRPTYSTWTWTGACSGGGSGSGGGGGSGNKPACRCPVGRRRMLMNPDLFTCEEHGKKFKLETETKMHTCDSGEEIECKGPGYVCRNKKGVEKEASEKEGPPEQVDFEGEFARYEEWCSEMKSKDDCKNCLGKYKKKKCTASARKKLRCKKVKDNQAFCENLGCKYNGKQSKCIGKPNLE